MSMYFYDDTDDWPEYTIVKNEINRLEKAHLEIRKALQDAESDLRPNPENEELKVKIDRLKKRLKGIEKTLNESLSMYR